MWKRVSSDVKVEASQAFTALSAKDTTEKEKQPLLNEPLRECPLYLGSIIIIVNPSQALVCYSFIQSSCGQVRHYILTKITGLENTSAE